MPDVTVATMSGRGPAPSPDSSRDVYWPEFGHFRRTPVFDYSGLEPGVAIEGPTVLQADNTTYVVPPGWILGVEETFALFERV